MAFDMSEVKKGVAGIRPDRFEAPVREALEYYTGLSGGQVKFDPDMASRLYLTPDRGYSAASRRSEVRHIDGDTIGHLFVVALKEKDGTGGYSEVIDFDSVSPGIYPRKPRILPTRKDGINTELVLPIAEYFTVEPDNGPNMFENNIALLGIEEDEVRKIGRASWSPGGLLSLNPETPPVSKIYDGITLVRPIKAVGYDENDQRFGDPGAFYNDCPTTVQVFGTIDLSAQAVADHPALLADLGARDPLPA
jgi:hypothetical protein